MLVTQSCPTLCHCPWNSPGKNTGVGCHFLLQGIIRTHVSNPGLLNCKQILYCLSHWEAPQYSVNIFKWMNEHTFFFHLDWYKEMIQFSSVAQSCLTLCNFMDCSTPGFPVHHQLPELAQTHSPSSQWCHPTIIYLLLHNNQTTIYCFVINP